MPAGVLPAGIFLMVVRAVPGALLVAFEVPSATVLGSLSFPGTNGFYEGETQAVGDLLP